MKKVVSSLLVMFGLSACAGVPYNFEVNSQLDANGRGKSIYIANENKDATGAQLKLTLEDILQNNGWYILLSPQAGAYTGSVSYNRKHWQTKREQPLWGSGDDIEASDSTSRDYVKDVTGVDRVYEDNYRTCIKFDINKSGSTVYNSDLCVDKNITNFSDTRLFAEDIYTKYMWYPSAKAKLSCDAKATGTGYCHLVDLTK